LRESRLWLAELRLVRFDFRLELTRPQQPVAFEFTEIDRGSERTPMSIPREEVAEERRIGAFSLEFALVRAQRLELGFEFSPFRARVAQFTVAPLFFTELIARRFQAFAQLFRGGTPAVVGAPETVARLEQLAANF